MNGVAFGKEIKKMRSKVGVPSKELAKRVGKAVTYVSQLERGLIKKPDYLTSFNLLKELKVTESEIDSILEYFSIKSPERIEAENNFVIEQAEAHFDWYESQQAKLRAKNEQLHTALNKLIDYDVSSAEKLIKHIEALTTSQEKFSFLTSMFQYDYAEFLPEERVKIITAINSEVNKHYTLDEYDELVRKE